MILGFQVGSNKNKVIEFKQNHLIKLKKFKSCKKQPHTIGAEYILQKSKLVLLLNKNMNCASKINAQKRYLYALCLGRGTPRHDQGFKNSFNLHLIVDLSTFFSIFGSLCFIYIR